MKQFLKGFLACMAGMAIIQLCVPAFAASVISGVTAAFGNIKLYLDGIQFTPTDSYGVTVQPLIYNNTTYLPIRSLANMFGRAVDWDQDNNAVYFTSNSQIDANTIIKRVSWDIGGERTNTIDLTESSDKKWSMKDIDKPLLTFQKDEYISDGSTTDGRIHRFSFHANIDVPIPLNLDDPIADITFVQSNGSQMTGKVLIYEVYMSPEPEDEKPVIYLYPQEKTDVSVSLDYTGTITCTYPKYNDGWHVTAYPDGRLINDGDGLEYSYLFWEGQGNFQYNMNKGFVVKGEDTAAFLREKLSLMGLLPKEYNEFIVYWLPRLQDNPYNLISFQNEAYANNAKLNITPEPDSILKVFAVFKALDKPVDIAEQPLKPFSREGFTVIEWGGSIIN